MRDKRAIVGALVFGAVIVVAAVTYPELSASEARRQLLAYAASVDPGQPRAKVVERFSASAYGRLRLHQGPDSLSVHTPHTFGARNWFLIVELSDNTVRCIRVRLSDNAYIRPEQAPTDRCIN
jgi:hypothetical protein